MKAPTEPRARGEKLAKGYLGSGGEGTRGRLTYEHHQGEHKNKATRLAYELRHQCISTPAHQCEPKAIAASRTAKVFSPPSFCLQQYLCHVRFCKEQRVPCSRCGSRVTAKSVSADFFYSNTEYRGSRRNVFFSERAVVLAQRFSAVRDAIDKQILRSCPTSTVSG